MNKIARGLAIAAAAALPITFAASPAHAAIPSDGIATDGVGYIETQSAVDGSGVKYTVSVDWNYKYTYLGKTRVSVNPLVIYRSDANVLATGNPEDAGVDVHFDVYSSNTQIQHRVYDGIDLDAAADNQVSLNPANPVSNADSTEDPDDAYSYVRIKVGTDADGEGNTSWMIFRQREGIGLKPA